MMESSHHSPLDRRSLDGAIEQAVGHIKARQRDDGSWDEPCDGGPASTAQALLALEAAGSVDATLARRCLTTALRSQRADGGFEPYPGAGCSEAGATASVLGALQRLGGPEHQGALERARRWLAQAGGDEAILGALARGNLGALFAAWTGVLDPRHLPAMPAELLRIPGVLGGLHGRFHPGLPLFLAQSELLRRSLLRRPVEGWLARWFCEQLERLRNPCGSVVGLVPHTSLALLALRAARAPAASINPLARWLLGQLEEGPAGPWFPCNHSDLWTTACTTRALLLSGLSPRDRGLQGAIRWLMAAQSDVPQAPGCQRTPGAVRTGGFGFQKSCVVMPDSDDTAVALMTLGACLDHPALPGELREPLQGVLHRGMAFLWAMQNSDGGWPAYVHDLPGKPPGPILTRSLDLRIRAPGDVLRLLRSPNYAFGDPSTEDVTARVLRALALEGADLQHPRARRGVAFLKEQQMPSGAWWGRWSTNYLWSTAHVICGLREIGTPRGAAELQRARGFLVAHQNEDGGFGETEESYRDPSLAGRGPSMPPVTACVLEALVALGEARSAAAERAVRHLLATQTAEGSWPLGGHLQVFIPPDSYYVYPGSGHQVVLAALASYRQALGARSA